MKLSWSRMNSSHIQKKKAKKYVQVAIDDTQYIFSGFWLFYLFWGCYKGWLFCMSSIVFGSVFTHGRLPSVDNVSCLIHRIYGGYSPAKLAEADISCQIQRHMIKWLGNKAQNFNRCTKHLTLILFWSPSCWTVQLTPSISNATNEEIPVTKSLKTDLLAFCPHQDAMNPMNAAHSNSFQIRKRLQSLKLTEKVLPDACDSTRFQLGRLPWFRQRNRGGDPLRLWSKCGLSFPCTKRRGHGLRFAPDVRRLSSWVRKIWKWGFPTAGIFTAFIS